MQNHLDAPYEQLTPDNCSLVMIDHQMGLMLTTGSIDLEKLRRNTLGLAAVAKLFGIPTFVTTGGSQVEGGRGFNGPVYPELLEVLGDVEPIERTSLNAWKEPRVVDAIESTGRKKLLLAGISSDICLTYTSVMATDAGYETYFIVDASSTWDQRTEMAAFMRMTQRGVILTNWVSVAAELQADWKNTETADDYFQVLAKYDAAFDGVGQTIMRNGGRLS